MNKVLSSVITGAVCVVLLTFAGCASEPVAVPQVEPPPPQPEFGEEANAFLSFKRIILGNGGVLYISANSAFESYDNWLVASPVIEFDENQVPLTSEEQAALRMLMFKARVGQVKDFGSVVQEPSACTLTQQLHLKKLLMYKSGKTGSQVNFVSSLGEAILVVEIKDSLSNQTLFAYIEPIKLGYGVTKSASPEISRLGAILKDVMRRSTRAVVEEIPMQEEEISNRAEIGCSGQIGKNLIEIRSVLRGSDG